MSGFAATPQLCATCIPTNVSQTESAAIKQPAFIALYRHELSQYGIFIQILSGCRMLLSLVGIVTNSFNLTTFFKIGLNDGVTLTFFNLAIMDLGVACCVIAGDIFLSLWFVEAGSGTMLFILSPWVPLLVLQTIQGALTSGSVLLTTYLAVQRCCCVALPFRFREVFNKKVSVYVIVGVFMIAGYFAASFFSLYEVTLRPTMLFPNGSRYAISFQSWRYPLWYAIGPIRAYVITFGCEAVVLVCVLIMVIGLRRSIQFKKYSTRIVYNTTDPESKETVGSFSKQPRTSEHQLIKSVLLVSVIFASCNCNAPGIALILARFAVPGFMPYGDYPFLYQLLNDVKSFLELLNSSINFFIYMRFNSKFRENFAHIVRKNTKN